MEDTTPIGLLAGGGALPILTAQGIRAAGRRVACVGFNDQYEAGLPDLCDQFVASPVIRLNRWIRILHRFDVRQAVLVGTVRKARMYDRKRVLFDFPDWRMIKLWYGSLRHDKRSRAIFAALTAILDKEGIELIDTTRYIGQCLADEGVLTQRQPGSEDWANLRFAWPLVRHLTDLDIGQAITAKDCEVIAVEAMEGTDAMIRRTGELCRRGGWTLIKAAKADHDMRFDVPTVGSATIEQMHQHGGRCLAIEAGKVIMADKAELLALADRYKIAVIGYRGPEGEAVKS
jgi:DUF1009 family protein